MLGSVMAAVAPDHPVRLSLDAPDKIANWRPLVHWLLGIPQLLVAGAVQTLRQVLQFISFFTILFTRKIPPGIFDVIVMAYRYEWRVNSYVFWMREPYPPFTFTPAAQDDGIDPASVSVEYPQELNRWLPLVKWLLAIPHYVVLVFLWIAAVLMVIVSFFAVLFTGRYPAGIRGFVIGVGRWSLRVRTYVGIMTDIYPPFSLR